MSNASVRRHYRVAEKNIRQSPVRRGFISKKEQKRFIPLAAAMILAFFIEGFIVGWLFGNHESKNSN